MEGQFNYLEKESKKRLLSVTTKARAEDDDTPGITVTCPADKRPKLQQKRDCNDADSDGVDFLGDFVPAASAIFSKTQPPKKSGGDGMMGAQAGLQAKAISQPVKHIFPIRKRAG